MRMTEIIEKKKAGQKLTEEEIEYFVSGYTAGEIPDYQAAALLMAICFTGMDAKETADLTGAMARSGEMADLSAIAGVKVDKHSTGGVGDKTTLIVAPLVASCGVPVAKMSGRGLGFTGGTIDKLESIPGFVTAIDKGAFIKAVQKIGVCIAGQTGNLAPADKKLYALRDVTATVDSTALIAASVMSKKIAAGADAVLLDVKYGSGAFMKTPEEAEKLALTMIEIGKSFGKNMGAVLSDMSQPLGNCVGNALEVAEAVEVLSGAGPADLRQLSLTLASQMLVLAGAATQDEAYNLVKEKLASGAAYEKFCQMVQNQGGDIAVVQNPALLTQGADVYPVPAVETGYITGLDAKGVGQVSMRLGAGREDLSSKIDMAAGVVLCKKRGDYVQKGEILAKLFTKKAEAVDGARQLFYRSLFTAGDKPHEQKLVYKII